MPGRQSRPDISWRSGVTAVVQWASALDNGNVIPKRSDASWLQDQEQRFLTKGRPTRRSHCGRSEHWIFKAWEIFCDGTRTGRTDKAGILPMPAHRSEFPPAIPRRVASQQSPLPLRRIRTWNQEQSLSSMSCFRLPMPDRKNSPPALDSAHISCRPAAAAYSRLPWTRRLIERHSD